MRSSVVAPSEEKIGIRGSDLKWFEGAKKGREMSKIARKVKVTKKNMLIREAVEYAFK